MPVTESVILELYKRFSKRPATLDARNLCLLADFIVEDKGVSLEEDSLVFTETPPGSPFREIPFENVHGVADLSNLLAIVLHSSIIFLNKKTLQTSVHIKRLSPFKRLISKVLPQ